MSETLCFCFSRYWKRPGSSC